MLEIEGDKRRLQLILVRLARGFEDAFGTRQGILDRRDQLVRRHRLPVGTLDLLDDPVQHLASAFDRDKGAIALLFRLEIADADVEQVPRELDIGSTVPRFLGEGRLERLNLGSFGYARRGVVVVSPIVAGICGDARQHLRQGEIQLTLLQRDLGLRELSVIIVLECPSDRLFDGQRPLDRQVTGFENTLIVARPLVMLFGRDRVGRERATCQRREGECRKTAARCGVERGIGPSSGQARIRKGKKTHDALFNLEVPE